MQGIDKSLVLGLDLRLLRDTKGGEGLGGGSRLGRSGDSSLHGSLNLSLYLGLSLGLRLCANLGAKLDQSPGDWRFRVRLHE